MAVLGVLQYKQGVGSAVPNSFLFHADSDVGYVDEIRITHSAAWTSNFTPPTAPYE
jgi:hypothetical protein